MIGVGIINAETEKNKRSKHYLKVLHNLKERSQQKIPRYQSSKIFSGV